MKLGPNQQRTHKARGIKKQAVSALADRLPTRSSCHAQTKLNIAQVAFLATAHRTSVTDACEDSGRLNPDTFFDNLRDMTHTTALSCLREANDAILRLAREEDVLPAECAIAIDQHVDPDYSEKHEGCIGYPELPGTDYGMSYISTESITPPARFTFAFTPVRAGTDQEKVLEEQLEATLKWTRVSLALLDRGFARTYVYLALLKHGIRFVVPLPDNERVSRLEEEAWRKRVYIPNTSYSYHTVPEYVIKESGKEGRSATVQLVFFFEPDPKDTTKDKCFIFVTNPGPMSAQLVIELAERYRERFGIEAGYRSKNELRVRTTSAHYATRLFMQLFCIITYNVWTLLRAVRARETGRVTPKRRDAVLLRRFLRALVIALTK